VHLLVDAVQVDGELRIGIRRSVEVEEVLGSFLLCLQQVVEVEPEPLCELADLRVSLVDQLAAVLGDLAAAGPVAVRPAAPADPRRRLVHLSGDACLLEPVGAGQSGESRADDDHPWGGRTSRETRKGAPGCRRESRRGTALEQLAAGRALLRDLGDGCLDRLRQWCSRHVPSPE
jgi:hypothetical protein